MRMKVSREQVLRIVTFLFMGFTLFGLDLEKYGLTQDSAAEFIITGVLIVGMLADAIGYLLRRGKGDVDNLGVFKKIVG